MDTHKNAPLTPKGREMMVRAWSTAGCRRPPLRASSTSLQRPSPNGSNASAPKGSTACVIARLVLFHRRAKRRLPQPRRSRFCGGSATPPSRSRSRLACRRRPSAAFCAALASTGSQPSSRHEPIRRYEREKPGELIHIDIKKLGRIGSVGHRITGRQTGAVNRHRGIGWEFVHVCIDDASRIAFSQVMKDEKKKARSRFSRPPSPITPAWA